MFINGIVRNSSYSTDIDPYWNNVIALYDFKGTSTSVINYKNGSNILTAGGSGTILTSPPVTLFGGNAVYFNGFGYLYSSIPGLSSLTSTYTIEAWVYPTVDSTSAANKFISTRGSGTGWELMYISNRFAFESYNPVTTPQESSTVYSPNSGWYHVAWTSRSNGNNDLYVNGVNVLALTGATMSGLSGGDTLNIGASLLYSEFYSGYVDSLRITSGIARYAGGGNAFTPPTKPFPKRG